MKRCLPIAKESLFAWVCLHFSGPNTENGRLAKNKLTKQWKGILRNTVFSQTFSITSLLFKVKCYILCFQRLKTANIALAKMKGWRLIQNYSGGLQGIRMIMIPSMNRNCTDVTDLDTFLWIAPLLGCVFLLSLWSSCVCVFLFSHASVGSRGCGVAWRGVAGAWGCSCVMGLNWGRYPALALFWPMCRTRASVCKSEQ